MRAAFLSFAWLLLVDVTLCFATTLSGFMAIALGAGLLGVGIAGIRQCCLLTTTGAVREIGWSEDGRWQAWVGACRRPLEVHLGDASFRFGDYVFLLWFKSCDGIHAVLIDVQRQHPDAIRRLARRLNWAPERAVGEPARDKLLPSDPKV